MAECIPYKRHVAPCKFTDRSKTRCDCPCYAQGTIRDLETNALEYVDRKSLYTTDMALARKIVRTWHINGTSNPIEATPTRTLDTTVQEFLDTRTHGAATNQKLTLLLQRKLIPFCTRHNVEFLEDVSYELLKQFVKTLKNNPRVNYLDQQRLQSFCRWCIKERYITDDPADRLDAIPFEDTQKNPFTADEMTRILDACSRFTRNMKGRGVDRVGDPVNMRALVLLMRHVGMRIGDAVVLRWSDIGKDEVKGKIIDVVDFVAQKNGVHIHIPLHRDALDAMRAIPRDETDYVFWRSHRSPKDKHGKTLPTATSAWMACLTTLFEMAEVENATSHRFRHTCATSALAHPIPVEQVAEMLGDTIDTVVKFYSAKTKERQDRLNQMITSQWEGIA